MKAFYLVLFAIYSHNSYSQSNSNYEGKVKTIDYFNIGDSIVKFQNLLSCADHQSKEIEDLHGKLHCKAFRFLPADSMPMEIENVRFKNIFLFPDENAKVKMVTFIKVYMKSDTINSKKQANNDFNKIEQYLYSIFKEPGKYFIPAYGENEYYSQDGVFWIRDKIKYALTKSKMKGRKTKKMTNSLDFSYFVQE